MNFNSIWKNYLNEDKELELLVEARVKDIKKKYATLDKGGWINFGRRQIEGVLGPKGVSKYLMWFARELRANFIDDIDEPGWAERMQADSNVFEVANALLASIMTFQENQQRMEEKDIYKFNAGELQYNLSKLGLSSKEKRDKEKESAMESAEIVYDENDIFAVRPLSTEASCYFGKSTRWCISATQGKNYFDQYTSENKAFVMVRFNNIPAEHELHKLALVYDRSGDLEDVFDAADDEVGESAVYSAVTMNRLGPKADYDLIDDDDDREAVDEEASDLVGSGYNNVLDNPPDATQGYDDAARELEQEYADKIVNGSYSYEIDDYGEGSYMMFNGSFTIELNNEVFEGGEYDTSHLSESDLINKYSEAQLYFDDIEVYDHSGVTTFELRMSTENYEGNPDGYDSFLDNMAYYDKDFPKIRRVLMKFLSEEEYIAPSTYDSFRKTLANVQSSLKNFEITDNSEYLGDEEIRFEAKEGMTIPGLETREQLKSLTTEKYGRFFNPDLSKKVVSKLEGLNKALQTVLAQQLELPISDLPPRVVQSISIPESLTVFLEEDVNERKVSATVRLTMDNAEADQEELDATLNIVRFIDNNFERVQQAVIESGVEIMKDMVQAQKDFLANMPDVAKNLIALAKTSQNSRVKDLLKKLPDYSRGAYKANLGLDLARGLRTTGATYMFNQINSGILRPIWNQLSSNPEPSGEFLVPSFVANPMIGLEMEELSESLGAQPDIDRYFRGIEEEKGRTRQSGIYRFHCMIGCSAEDTGNKQRGLEDILADLRALEGVTIVTVVIANRKIAEGRYISGLSIKFIPSSPGQVRSPEDTKARILRETRRLRNVERIFKISTSVERIE
jgi:hypothetical protein